MLVPSFVLLGKMDEIEEKEHLDKAKNAQIVSLILLNNNYLLCLIIPEIDSSELEKRVMGDVEIEK